MPKPERSDQSLPGGSMAGGRGGGVDVAATRSHKGFSLSVGMVVT